jgi:hypothetical protein
MIRINLFALALLFAALPAPADDRAAGLLPPDRTIEQAVDHYIDAALRAANVKPAPPADDAALLRRLTLDLVGRIPTPAELTAYLANSDPHKKVKLVDRLIATPAFARHLAQEFSAFLQVNGDGKRRGANPGALRDYLQGAFAENRPWDRIFRELLLPDESDPKARGAAEFLRTRVKDLNRLTIDVSTAFFGVNISCAQCHDHPHVTDWKQDHFYGMKAFFARTFDKGGRLGERDQGVVKFIPNKGKEKVARVMFLTGKVVEEPPASVPAPTKKKTGPVRTAPSKTGKASKAAKPDKSEPARPGLRAKLVELVLEPGQREYFARAIVNRTFHRLLGRGLVMPLDQMHSANPPSHPELLDWLARDLIEHRYDLRRLVRGLVLTNVYARGSRWEDGEAPSEKLFAVGQVRPLTPMQIAVSLRIATADPEALAKDAKKLEALEKSAARLASLFPQPGDNFQVGASEAMLFANNEAMLRELLADAPGALVNRLKQVADLDKRADMAVRSVLSRPGRPDEIKALVEYLRGRADRPVEACQQAVWALLASAEFRFNY